MFIYDWQMTFTVYRTQTKSPDESNGTNPQLHTDRHKPQVATNAHTYMYSRSFQNTGNIPNTLPAHVLPMNAQIFLPKASTSRTEAMFRGRRLSRNG